MKKTLLSAAALLLTIGAQAQDINITMAEDEPFEFSNGESYVCIYLGDESRATNIPEDNYIYFGPDGDNGRNLWVWSDTYDFPTANGLNSLGVPGEFMSVQVKSVGWSGLGYNIAKANPVNLSFVDGKWSFHMAVRTQYKGAVMFNLTDGNGTEAHLVFGDEGATYDDHEAIANFERDGEWYNIDIPMEYLEDQFEFTLTDAKAYSDKNYFVVCCGGVQGTVVDYDAVFFHGPKVDAALFNETEGIGAVKADSRVADGVYNLQGQRLSDGAKGLRIVKSGSEVHKVIK